MKSPKTRTCLIGGAGFIGGTLSNLLIDKGREVIIIDLAMPARLNPKVSFIRGDYGNRIFLQQALVGIDEIVVLAYASVPKTSFEDPLADITNNLPPTLSLLDTARELSLRKIVVVSSGGTVYGKANSLPIGEDHPTFPISPYGITKLAIEKYATMYNQLYGLPTIILRPGNAYGESQRPYTGQGFIATAIASVINNKAITLFGDRGTVRDYIHVEDIAQAIISTLNEGKIGECYNIGTGRGSDNSDIIKMIDALASPFGLKSSLAIQPARNFDVPINILDSTKLTQSTGWEPSLSLEEGIKRSWDWFYEKT